MLFSFTKYFISYIYLLLIGTSASVSNFNFFNYFVNLQTFQTSSHISENPVNRLSKEWSAMLASAETLGDSYASVNTPPVPSKVRRITTTHRVYILLVK